jgi:hypothetical protein
MARPVTEPIPGVDEYAKALQVAKDDVDPFFSDPQPTYQKPSMNELGKEIAARFKETFYSYAWRDGDNRNTQLHVGPSEVGTPCDRRLAMSLMRVNPVHPGGEGWPAFIGTCVHAGLADMFVWSGGGSGRYLVEVPLSFDSEAMPRGTGDLIDRVMHVMIDHKVLGRWSMNQLRNKGPSPTYRTQIHLYAHGARKAGHSVDNVAIVGWPRDSSNLDQMFVWTEPFNPGIVKDTMDRLDRITGQIALDSATVPPLQLARKFEAADDCRFCRYHAKGDDEFTRGCPGR